MNFLYLVSIVFVQISSIKSEWQLAFSDHFNESLHYDENKWVIGINNSQLVKVMDGNLALLAERRIVKGFKVPKRTIISARYAEFNEGRFVFRLKLSPKFISLANLFPKEESCDRIEWKEFCGSIVIIACNSPTYCGSGMVTGLQQTLHGIAGIPKSIFSINPTDDFHEYALEWKANEYINWFIDGEKVLHQTLKKYLKMNFDQNFDKIGAPFDKHYFPRFVCYTNEHDENDINDSNTDWQNALMVDYVQVYKWIDDKVNERNSNYKLIIVLVFSLFVILLITISVLVFKYRKIKKIAELKKIVDQIQFETNKDDVDIVYDDLMMESSNDNNVYYEEVIADQEYDVVEEPRYVPMEF